MPLGRIDADLPSLQSKFATRVHDLEEKLTAVIKSEESTTKAINDTLTKLSNVLKNQKLTREMIDEKKSKKPGPPRAL